MDLPNLLGESGGPDGTIDPNRVIGGVRNVFASKGGVDGLVSSLRAGGLGNVVNSWVSTGANQAVEPQQLGAALGPDTVNQLSAKTGLSVGALLPLLASLLPMIINHLTPDGKVPKGGATSTQGDIGDLLGGILGGELGGMLGGGR